MKDPHELVCELQRFRINVLIDVRSKPYGRKFLFNKKRLEPLLEAAGIRYVWKGDRLGGFSAIEDQAIAKLAEWQKDQAACLMCMEANPDQCHRKYEIGRRIAVHGVEIRHLPLQAPDPQENSLFG